MSSPPLRIMGVMLRRTQSVNGSQNDSGAGMCPSRKDTGQSQTALHMTAHH